MKILRTIVGYIASIFQLRKTRIRLTRLQPRVKKSEQRLSRVESNLSRAVPFYQLEIQSAQLLREVGALDLNPSFDARKYVENSKEFRVLYTNGENKDVDGGFHENLKTVLRISEIRRDVDLSEMTGVVLMVQRLRQGEFWKALYYASSFGKDVVFTETTFFGAFAGYFVQDIPSVFRKSFGYILDDRGYYFDARNPTRLESFLNSDESVLPPDQIRRSERLIERIISKGITKYNFSDKPRRRIDVPSNSVLIIDQKKGDASIEFGGAQSKTFHRMIRAAIIENPGVELYVKQHPDNRGKQIDVLDDRVTLLDDDIELTSLLDQCSKVYVMSSQVGFEAILRNKIVEVFGMPFYAGWGLTHDRQQITRRTRSLTKYELFHAACIRQSVYVNPDIGEHVEIEEAFDWMLNKLRAYEEFGASELDEFCI